jgi:acyl-CoA thioesterase-2
VTEHVPYEATPEESVAELVDALTARPVTALDVAAGTSSFEVVAPDWFGDRVFGGMTLGQAISAAAQTVPDQALHAHSMHAYFLGPLAPGRVTMNVATLRDGRTFRTRQVTATQNGRDALTMLVSFHADEPGDEYELPMPDYLPDPDSLPPMGDVPPPLDLRWIGSPQRDDGTYESTRRCWVRTAAPMPHDLLAHLGVTAFLSDMTGSAFRPHSLGEWGNHTDATIDHAVWFHRPLQTDEWVYTDFEALVNRAGRATVRARFHDRAGHLCLSMAQELLIRPLG